MPLSKIFNRQPSRFAPRAVGQVNPKDDGEIVSFVNTRWTGRTQLRQNLDQQWYTNVAQYIGLQYHVYNRGTGKMEARLMKPWRVRLVANRLMPVVRKIVSKALRQQPQWTSIPATGEQEDANVSQIAEKVLRYYWRALNMDRKLVEAFYWMGCTGNAFLSVAWDPGAGFQLGFGDEEIEELMPNFSERLRNRDTKRMLRKGLRLGDLRVEVHSPFAIDPDPEATDIDEASHVLHTTSRTLSWLEDRYGSSKVKGVALDSVGSDGTLQEFYERRLQNITNSIGGGSSGVAEANPEQAHSVRVHEAWVNPSSRYPKGWYAVVAGGKVMESRLELPNPFRRAPFAHLLEIPVPGRFWGTCALEQAIPIQAGYNRGRSQLVENRNLMTRPKWLVPRGSQINQTQLDDQPGEKVEYAGGFAPTIAEMPQLPEWVLRILDFDLKDMEDITAIHEVTQARAPTNVRSGVAIAQLQEQDDQMLAPTFMIASRELSRLGSWALQLIAENVKEDRILKIVGKDKQVESFSFKGGDLFGQNRKKPGVDYFDVDIQLGSQLPQSKQARLQFVIDLVNNGILSPQIPEQRDKILRMLEIGTDEGVLPDDALDRQNAMLANIEMMRGNKEAAVVHPSDNALVHLEELRRFQKFPQYRQNATDEIDELFEERARLLESLITPESPQQQEPPPVEAPPPLEAPPPTPIAPAVPSDVTPQLSPDDLIELLSLAEGNNAPVLPEELLL